MATIQQSLPQLNGASPARTPSVIMGRQDYISVLLRLTAMELYKIRRRLMSKALLGFGLLFMVGIFFFNFLCILAMVLMGTIVGGEYSLGTVHLMFTRGPTRLQFLFAKIAALAVCIVIGVVILAVVGVLVGLLFNVVSGIAPTYGFFTSNWFGHMLLYILLMMFTWLLTHGRSWRFT